MTHVAGSGRLFVQDRIHDQCRILACEGPLVRCHFVKHNTERKQVGTCVKLFSAHLLRRHVRSCTQDTAVESERCIPGLVSSSLRGEHLGQSEIQDFYPRMSSDENVSGIDIPVNVPFGCRAANAFDSWNAKTKRSPGGMGLFPNWAFKAFPIKNPNADT